VFSQNNCHPKFWPYW